MIGKKANFRLIRPNRSNHNPIPGPSHRMNGWMDVQQSVPVLGTAPPIPEFLNSSDHCMNKMTTFCLTDK